MKRHATLLVLSVLLFAAAGLAQTPLKVAVVNSQRAFELSAEGKRIAAQLQERDAKIKSDLQKMDDAIRALETRLNTQRLTLTQEAGIQLQSEIDRKTTDRKRAEEDGGREWQQLQVNLITKMRGDMVVLIEGIAKEKGYDLVLDLAASGTVYFNPAIEITDEVVRRYDTSKATSAPVKK